MEENKKRNGRRKSQLYPYTHTKKRVNQTMYQPDQVYFKQEKLPVTLTLSQNI